MYTHTRTYTYARASCGRSNNTDATAKWPSSFHVVLTLRYTVAARAFTGFSCFVFDGRIGAREKQYYSIDQCVYILYILSPCDRRRRRR